MKIRVDLRAFKLAFPYFENVTEMQLQSAYLGVPSIVSTTLGAINLTPELQTRAVYLACAHSLYLQLNPSAGKPLNSATEGSVSASFRTFDSKNALQFYLSTTPYGLELLAILQTVQPSMPTRRVSPIPYYPAGGRNV